MPDTSVEVKIQTPEITKRRVTMSEPLPFKDTRGEWIIPDAGNTVTDYVRPDFLDAYVADARLRWSKVDVGPTDAGPNGYNGPTIVPAQLSHDLAGQVFAATYTPEELQQAQAQFSTATLRNGRGSGGTALMTHVGLQSTAAAASAGTALAGARQPTAWAARTDNGTTSTAATTQTNAVAAGETVASLALYNALTAGTFQSSVDVTSQPFSSAGTYQSTISDNQS